MIGCNHPTSYDCTICMVRRCMTCDAPTVTDDIKTAVRACDECKRRDPDVRRDYGPPLRMTAEEIDDIMNTCPTGDEIAQAVTDDFVACFGLPENRDGAFWSTIKAGLPIEGLNYDDARVVRILSADLRKDEVVS